MNLSLLDPFQADFPELIEEYLERGHVKCISFNRRGTLLAAGCTDGACVIWDFHTRGVAKELRDTSCSASISSVNWTKNGRYLLVAAADRSLVLWDVANGTKLHTATLEQPALSVRLNPKNSSLCLACPIFNAPYLVDLESGSFYTLPVSVEKLSESGNISRLKSVSGNAQFCPSVACFDKTGDTIFIGSSKEEERHMDRQRKRKWGLIEKMEGNPFQKDSLLNGYLKSERRVMIPSSQATTNSLLDND